MSILDSHGNDEVANIIEAIQMQWQIFTSTKVIATKLHLPKSDVEYVIANGFFPAKQLEIVWADIHEPASTDSQPHSYETEGQR